jgi:hypothetical protein
MSKKQTKKRLATCLVIALLMISTFSVLFKIPSVLLTVHAQGAGASVTLVHGPAQGTASILSGTFTITLGYTPTSGDVLILGYLGCSATVTPQLTGIGQTGVTWSQVVAASGDVASIWMGNVGASAGTVITLTIASGGATDLLEIADVCEWSGLSGVVDQSSSNAGGTGTALATGTTGTITKANELLVGITIGAVFNKGVSDSAAQSSPTNSFTLLDGANVVDSSGNDASLAYLYKVVSSTGTYSSGTTSATEVYWEGCIATFFTTSSAPTSFYPMSGASNPISSNPTDQHGFDVVHTTNIVQCNTTVSGATRTYLAYDSNEEGSLINLYYSNSINGTWTAYSGNPILSGSGEFRTPSVVLVSGTFYMFLNNINNKDIELWTSTNGITFTEIGTVLTTSYDEWTAPFVWLNPNDNTWYLFWTQGYDSGGWWEIMARNSSTITGFSTRSDTVVMNVTYPYNNAFPSIMYANGVYWLLTEAETSENSGLWRVNAWYSTKVTSGYSLANNSPILTSDEACPNIFIADNGVSCYLFTDQNSAYWYQEIRTVYTAPTVSVSPSSWTIDVGQSKTFTATASGGSGSYASYQWYVGGVAQSGATASTFSFAPASAGSYSITVTVTDSSGATSAQSSPATVTVNSALVAPTVTATPTTVNQGQTSSLTSTAVTTGTSPYTYQWLQQAPGGSYVDVGTNSASYSFVTSSSTAPGVWSFELQVADSTGAVVTSSAATVTVNISNVLTVSVSPSSWTMDVGQSKVFSASASGGSGTYASYQWYVGGAAQSGATVSTFSFAPASAGSYSITVTVTDSSGATSPQSSPATVTVAASPTVSVAPVGPLAMDVGQVQTFTATVTGGSGTINYQWYIDGTAVGSNSASYSYTAAGTSHTVNCKVTDSASTPVTSPASNAVTITVAASPTVSISPGSATLDVGQSTTFTATASGGSGSLSFQWYVNSVLQSAATSSFTYTASATGIFTIYVQVTDSASTPVTVKSNSATVNVNSALVAPTASASPATVDQGHTSSLTSTAVTTGTSPYTYQWLEEAPGATSYSDVGTSSASFSFATTASTSTGVWSFELQVTDSTGAVVTSSAVTVKVDPALAAPTVTATPTTVARGQTSSLTSTTVTTGSGGYTYQWLEEAPGAHSYSAISGATSSSYSFVTSSSTSTGTWHFELRVTDSTGASVTSNVVTVRVTRAA